jgi:hypothetical protein
MFKKLRILCCTGLLFGVIHSKPSQASPGAYGLASIVPGFGQAFNGQILEGLSWLVVTGGLMTSQDTTLSSVGMNLWMYNMYDAYRDAGGKPTDNKGVVRNWVSNINPVHIFDPIGASVVGLGLASGASNGYPALRSPRKLIEYSFVGLGEEGLFRGFLYPSLSNTFNSKFVGAFTSSLLFSAGHLNFEPFVFSVRFLAGMVFCWQLTRNKYDLSSNIFAHSWYDVFVDSGEEAKISRLSLRWNATF